ncbi:tetratricopeptide repeat protein [Akkermansiaceae bacterium]|nr:tetratricopeptide repeat protein [Akkermansiaceae bacterium]
MTPKSNLRRTLAMLLLSLGLLAAPVQAQAVQEFNTNAITAMKAGKWGEAQAILKQATELYDGRALTLFGPRFGSFWYNRGYCELMLGMYPDAMKSFEKCYKKYPNGKGGENESINLYHKKSLLYLGHAAKGAGAWDVAIKTYKKFLAERDPTRDKYQPGVFYTNMAICYFKLRKISEGSKNLETSIVNKVKFRASNKNILLCFNAMVEAVIDKNDEKALLDFIAKNRGHIKLDPFEAYEFAPLFMKLALDAKGAEMMRSSFELYSLVPSTVAAIDDVEARLKMVGKYPRLIRDGSKLVKKEALEKDLEALKDAQKTGQMNEVYAMLNTAVMHEDDGNTRGAFAVYEQMELYFPNAKIFRDKKIVPAREKNLYNLVRTSSIIGEVLTTEKYGSRFLKAFPNSEYADEVRRLTLSSLFWEGEYAKCIEVASVMIDKLPKPSEQHDICLFVLGGSHHYSGSFDVAQPMLDEHVKTYPKTKGHRRQAALYFQGSNLFRLQYWTKSAALLDSFLKEYPEAGSNPYLPFALFDRSNCHFAEEEYTEALEKVTRVETEFPGFGAMESIFALKGNILENTAQPAEAVAYYEKALALAETKENDIVSGEVLLYLVNILGAEKVDNEDNPDIQKALPYYDRFWKSYQDSPYRAQVAVTGLPAMRAGGRIKEGLETLQGVIAELSKIEGTPGLEQAINSYTESYLEENTPAELKDHYYNFPGIDANDAASRALLRIAIIGVYEDKLLTATKEESGADISQAQATIKVLFNELKTDFDSKDLSDYILVSIGDFLREKTSSPSQSKSYYQAALDSSDKAYEFPALFGLADVLGQGSKADRVEAIKVLGRVYADADKKDQKEKALFRIVSIEFENENYEEAIKRGRAYLADKTIKQRNGPVARLMIAQSYDKQGKSEDAIGIYGQIWTTSQGYIKVSAPALKRYMELLWERNGSSAGGTKSDRQKVYEEGWKWVDGTKAFSKLTDSEKADRDAVVKLVGDYEAYPEIKSMATILEEKKNGN